ncbi:MAG TPA: NADH-quinone oxidoreductase subunit J [Trueperaceae bacterium]|nr:NADH-quinone oxidoreductase subunit J [Trueperaceae bacterium]
MIGFFVIAAFAVAGAIMVVTARQPIHAALALVATLLAVAVAYITLDAHFLAAIQVIVYAGAIMVLFLFVIMLLNVERQPLAARWSWLRPTAYGVGLLALVAVAAVVIDQRRALPEAAVVAEVLQGGSAERIGTILFSDYLLAFHLVAVLLLTGIIGAVSLVQRAAAPERPAAAGASEPVAAEGEPA